MSVADATRSAARGAVAWMANNSVAANLLMFVLFFGGALGLSRMKVEVFPDFELDAVTVAVPYPGASPEEVEQGIDAQDRKDDAGGPGDHRHRRTEEEGAREGGLGHRVQPQVVDVDGDAEADDGPPQDPRHVGQQAAEVDPARVEATPDPTAGGSLRGEVDEGVGHRTFEASRSL